MNNPFKFFAEDEAIIIIISQMQVRKPVKPTKPPVVESHLSFGEMETLMEQVFVFILSYVLIVIVIVVINIITIMKPRCNRSDRHHCRHSHYRRYAQQNLCHIHQS